MVFSYILTNILMYKNENGRYMVRETESEQGILECPEGLGFDGSENVRAWNVLREYEGYFSAEEAIGKMIKVHMEGGVNV